MTRLRLVFAALLLFVVLGAGSYALRARSGVTSIVPELARREEVRAPSGVRIRVQVLNTTRTRGLARRATRVLRDRGFDVVEMGTRGPPRDTTLVIDRSGNSEWAAAVARILGPAARVEARLDSSRYLDVTVLLGSSWRAPAEPLYP